MLLTLLPEFLRVSQSVFDRTGGLHRLGGRDRIGSRLRWWQTFVDESVDERGVGAVLQQASHQIREQVLVGAHRRVHATSHPSSGGIRRTDDGIQFLAHAMQALELEWRMLACALQHRTRQYNVLHAGATGHAFATELTNGFNRAVFGDYEFVEHKFLIGRVGAKDLQQSWLRDLGDAHDRRRIGVAVIKQHPIADSH